MLKKTKIIATISDLHCDVEFIKQLYDNGMNVVRMNTAHQTSEDTLKVIKNVREVSDKIPLIIDTKGPEIRTTASDYKVAVKKGDRIYIKGDSSKSTTPDCIYVNYNHFVDELESGTKILIDDGDIEFEVLEKSDKVVVLGGNFEWTQSASFIEISTVGNMLELLHTS
jgi:pyruvate kinase